MHSRRISQIERAIMKTMAELLRVRPEHAEGRMPDRIAKPRIQKLLAALDKLKAEKPQVAIRRANSKKCTAIP